MTSQEADDGYCNPHVLISGAGIGGLCLANLFEAANINYTILEKATTFKCLGSAISLSGEVFTFLAQLGLYEELAKHSKPFKNINVRSLNPSTNQTKYLGKFQSHLDNETLFGYDAVMFARPDLFNILLAKIPKSKILMGQKVISSFQTEEKVTVKTVDGSEYSGDILIGADGCYSPVRQSMYQAMKKKGEDGQEDLRIPKSDLLELNYEYDCLVGVTKSLDLNQFPMLGDEKSEFEVFINQKESISIWYMPLVDNRIGWMVTEAIPLEKRKTMKTKSLGKENQDDKNSEWTSEAALEMCQRLSNHATPYGINFGELINHTPNDLISKVMLEEKMFETWNDGRICLIGDAAHKVLPFGGQGARMAMLDALTIANLLYDLPSNSFTDVSQALRNYANDRRERGRAAVKVCSDTGRLFHAQGFMADMVRKVVLNYVPDWLLEKSVKSLMVYRPQSIFLEFNKNIGTHEVLPQQYSPRYLKKKAAAAAAAVAAKKKAEDDRSRSDASTVIL